MTEDNIPEGMVPCDVKGYFINLSEELSHYGWVMARTEGGDFYSVRVATPVEMAHAKFRLMVEENTKAYQAALRLVRGSER